MNKTISANFFEEGAKPQFSYRRLHHAPRTGERVVFNGVRYEVKYIEWCLDEDATELGTRLNVIIKRMGAEFDE